MTERKHHQFVHNSSLLGTHDSSSKKMRKSARFVFDRADIVCPKRVQTN